MAPKCRARGAAGTSSTRGAAGRSRRGRGARAPRAARGHWGRGASSRGSSAEAADEGALIHLKRIYNFCLFHAHFVSLLHLFAMLLNHLLD